MGPSAIGNWGPWRLEQKGKLERRGAVGLVPSSSRQVKIEPTICDLPAAAHSGVVACRGVSLPGPCLFRTDCYGPGVHNGPSGLKSSIIDSSPPSAPVSLATEWASFADHQRPAGERQTRSTCSCSPKSPGRRIACVSGKGGCTIRALQPMAGKAKRARGKASTGQFARSVNVNLPTPTQPRIRQDPGCTGNQSRHPRRREKDVDA